MFLRHHGIVPAKMLCERIRFSRDVRLQMVEGSSPFNLLEESNKLNSFESYPRLDGIGPEIWYEEKDMK